MLSESLLRQVVELKQQKLGPDHPDTLAAINHLAACIRPSGEPGEGSSPEGEAGLAELLDNLLLGDQAESSEGSMGQVWCVWHGGFYVYS